MYSCIHVFLHTDVIHVFLHAPSCIVPVIGFYTVIIQLFFLYRVPWSEVELKLQAVVKIKTSAREDGFQSTSKEQWRLPVSRWKSRSRLMWAGGKDAGNLGQHECQMTLAKHKNSRMENWQVWKSASCWRMRRTGWVVRSRGTHVGHTSTRTYTQCLAKKTHEPVCVCVQCEANRGEENDRKTQFSPFKANCPSCHYNKVLQSFTSTTVL